MRFILAVAAMVTGSVAAHAETIDVRVERPATSEAYLLRSLAVERFSGTDARAFASAIERELAGLRDADGRALFEMFDAGAGEGAVTGRADVDIADGRYTQKRRLCPGTFDPQAKCEDSVKTEVVVNCRSRVITLEADIRVVRADDGRIVERRDLPQRDEARWCNGDGDPTETQSVVTDLIRRSANAAVAGLAPYAKVTSIRIREDRKGLDKDMAARFKAAVVATRGDGREGCDLFAALESAAPAHRALIFNLALCAEARGDYAAAIDGYGRVGDRDAGVAIARARATELAVSQAQARRGN